MNLYIFWTFSASHFHIHVLNKTLLVPRLTFNLNLFYAIDELFRVLVKLICKLHWHSIEIPIITIYLSKEIRCSCLHGTY